MSHLLAKHKNAENNLEDLGRTLDDLDDQGAELQRENIPGAENIPPRLQDAREYFNRLKDLAAARRQRLTGGVNYYQVSSLFPSRELLATLRSYYSSQRGIT